MAPLPPEPKITEISTTSVDDLVPFVEGWKNVNCPAEVSEGIDFYVTVVIKGNNLTEEWLTEVIKGAYYNGGSENQATISMVVNEADGEAFVDFNFNFPFVEGGLIVFDINGVKSGQMPIVKVI